MSIAAIKFDEVRRIVREEAGLFVDRGRTDLVDLRLLPLSRRFGASCVEEFVDSAIEGEDLEARRCLIEAMADHETAFFRDPAVFEWMRTKLLPELVAQNAATKTLRIWCAAASSGQEAYSMAILLEDNFPELKDWRVDLFATDLSETMLAKSREGVYSRFEVNRGLPAAALVKHFDRRGLNWSVKPSLKERVSFASINLAKPIPTSAPWDLVLLRYVLPSLDPAARPAILRNIRDVVSPSGRLVLGAAEAPPEFEGSWTISFDSTYPALRPVAGRQESR